MRTKSDSNKRRAPPKPPGEGNLRNIALYYVQRFAATRASLERVLLNRIRRAALRNPEFASDAAAQEKLRHAAAAIAAEFEKKNFVNDASFADIKAAGLRRQGKSRRVIAQKLAAKGVAPGLVTAALAQADEGLAPEEAEMKAALSFARKKRLGRFRGRTGKKLSREEAARLRNRDMAALARAGFGMDVCRKILGAGADADFDDAFEDLF